MHLVLRRGFETAGLDSREMHGLNRVENENDIMHYQTSLQRRKDGIPGSKSNNRKGCLNCLWSDPGKLISG